MHPLEDWKEFRYFNPKEFESPDCPDSGFEMNVDFVRVLERVREDCGFPLRINSGYRTQAHNIKVGGKPESEHTEGEGADIQAETSGERFAILASALKHGINRIGIGKTFIHLGFSKDLPQKVIWLY